MGQHKPQQCGAEHGVLQALKEGPGGWSGEWEGGQNQGRRAGARSEGCSKTHQKVWSQI